MKNVFGICLALALGLTPGLLRAQATGNSAATIAAAPKNETAHQWFIDKFFIPAAAKTEFYARARINRELIRKLPGFIRDEAFEHPDGNGNIICITIAEWESMDAINNAKEAVQAEYKKEGFNPAAFMQRLNITIDRGLYTRVGE